MKRKKFFFPLFLYFSLSLIFGCSTPSDTKTCVPLFVGSRFDSPAEFSAFQADLEWQEKNPAFEWIIEFPIIGDSAFPDSIMIPHGLLSTFRENAKNPKFLGKKISVSICNALESQTFPIGKINSPEHWFKNLRDYSDSILSISQKAVIDRIIFGKNLQPVEIYKEEWEALFVHLRKKYGAKVSYTTDADRVRNGLIIHSIGDEISIVYPPHSADRALEFSKINNLTIAKIADSLKKQVFILQSNILEEKKSEIFDFHLKYWNPPVEISGVTINTLYGKLPFIDSSSYFKLADETEFLEHLKTYSGNCR